MTASTRRVSTASYRVMIAIAVVILIVFFVFGYSNRQRERDLLQNETDQAATVATSTLSNVVAVLDTLATTTRVSDGSTQAFVAQAQGLVHSPVSVALVKTFLSRDVVFAAVGTSYRVDQVLSVATVDAIHPGGAAIATGPVVSRGDQSTATFAVGPPLVPSGNAIYLQFTVNPFTSVPAAVSRGFSDLQVALYGSDHPARSNLLAATSRQLAWPGPVASQHVVVGDANWTLIASAPEPLIGTVATVAPLVILILGLCLALATGVIVELFIRRRRTVLTKSESQFTAVEGPPVVTTIPNESAEVPAVWRRSHRHPPPSRSSRRRSPTCGRRSTRTPGRPGHRDGGRTGDARSAR